MVKEFPKVEAWDATRMVVSFPAETDRGTVRCAISIEALQDHCGADVNDALDAFRANRGEIESVAERLLENGRLEPDGSVLVRARDM